MTRRHPRARVWPLLAAPFSWLALSACHEPLRPSAALDAGAERTVPSVDASVTLDGAPADTTAADAAPAPSPAHDASATAFSGPRIKLNAESQITEDVEYGVDGTALRVRIHGTQRATLIKGGHVWGGTLTACDGDVCADLSLSGPSQPPVRWHGYGFVLVFVVPTSVRISHAS